MIFAFEGVENEGKTIFCDFNEFSRRRERRTEALTTGGDAMESEADDDGDARSLSSKSVRTAGADTVLDMLVDSDDQNVRRLL